MLLLWNLNTLHEKEQIHTSKAVALAFMGLLKFIMKNKFSCALPVLWGKSVELTTGKRNAETL